MTALLVDTSVLIKWFHSRGESGVAEARVIREANQSGRVEARIIDLALYEVGNVLLKGLGWSPRDVADQIDDLVAMCGEPLSMEGAWLRQAAELGHQHHLTFYDAAWAAAARGLGVPLVSADAGLVGAGLAESAAALVSRLRLRA